MKNYLMKKQKSDKDFLKMKLKQKLKCLRDSWQVKSNGFKRYYTSFFKKKRAR